MVDANPFRGGYPSYSVAGLGGPFSSPGRGRPRLNTPDAMRADNPSAHPTESPSTERPDAPRSSSENAPERTRTRNRPGEKLREVQNRLPQVAHGNSCGHCVPSSMWGNFNQRMEGLKSQGRGEAPAGEQAQINAAVDQHKESQLSALRSSSRAKVAAHEAAHVGGLGELAGAVSFQTDANGITVGGTTQVNFGGYNPADPSRGLADANKLIAGATAVGSEMSGADHAVAAMGYSIQARAMADLAKVNQKFGSNPPTSKAASAAGSTTA